MRKTIGMVAALIAGICAAPVRGQEAEARFNISRDDARCLLQHESEYRAIRNDPIILFLRLCPQVAPRPGDLARMNRNQEFIRINVKDERKGQLTVAVRRVVMLPRVKFDCFLRQVRQGARRRGAAVVPVNLRACR